MEGLLRKHSPYLLKINTEVEELANFYVKEGVIPEKYREDAVHIAASVVNEVEAIISWNFEHIVKLKIRIIVNGINKLQGYHDVEICSPEEVVEL